VTHPGSAKATTTSKALATCVDSLRRASKGLPLNGLTILIENTAGQGKAIGRTFEEVAEIISGAAQDLPVGACIDTAHCFAAGYPIHKPRGLAETLKQLFLIRLFQDGPICWGPKCLPVPRIALT